MVTLKKQKDSKIFSRYIYLKNDMTSRNFPNRMRELTPIETNPAVRLIKNVQETGNKKVDLKLN